MLWVASLRQYGYGFVQSGVKDHNTHWSQNFALSSAAPIMTVTEVSLGFWAVYFVSALLHLDHFKFGRTSLSEDVYQGTWVPCNFAGKF